jgi:hypothetical protein
MKELDDDTMFKIDKNQKWKRNFDPPNKPYYWLPTYIINDEDTKALKQKVIGLLDTGYKSSNTDCANVLLAIDEWVNQIKKKQKR